MLPLWISSILAVLGLVVSDMPIIEKFLAGFGQFIATEIAKVFPGSAAAVKVVAITKQAEDLVNMADQSLVDTAEWVKGEWPTVQELLAAFPGLEHSLYARYTVMQDNPGVTHGVAAKVVEAAHGNVRVSKP